jgi:hypothetical protein
LKRLLFLISYFFFRISKSILTEHTTPNLRLLTGINDQTPQMEDSNGGGQAGWMLGSTPPKDLPQKISSFREGQVLNQNFTSAKFCFSVDGSSI